MAAPLYEPQPRRARPQPRVKKRVADPFGFDPDFHAQMRPAVEWLYRKYWRVTTEGLDHIPASGPVIVAGNHSGGIPFDAVMLAAALQFDHSAPRILRFLYDKFVDAMPYMGTAYRRLGAVPAAYDNGLALLERGDAVGIFPEGVDGIGKGVGRRYQLQRFRTGFVRLSLSVQAPIVPVAVVGAEEIYPVIGKWKPTGMIKSLLNVPFIPVTPFFPFFGPFGAIPLPTRWHIRFGKPIHPYEHVDAKTLNHKVHVQLAEDVRKQLQHTIYDLLAKRERLF